MSCQPGVCCLYDTDHKGQYHHPLTNILADRAPKTFFWISFLSLTLFHLPPPFHPFHLQPPPPPYLSLPIFSSGLSCCFYENKTLDYVRRTICRSSIQNLIIPARLTSTQQFLTWGLRLEGWLHFKGASVTLWRLQIHGLVVNWSQWLASIQESVWTQKWS